MASTALSGIRSLLVDARSSHSGDILQRVGQQGAEGAVGGGGEDFSWTLPSGGSRIEKGALATFWTFLAP